MRHEINLVHPDVAARDLEMLMGPFDEDDGPFLTIAPEWTMAHAMHAAGLFPSVRQAKANGWNRPIPPGFTHETVGRRRMDVFMLTPMA